MNDYYQTLGIQKNATDDDIKKAYRKLAMKHHPDRGGNADEFKKIEEAHRILSDPQRRAEYDNPQPQGFGGFGGFGGGGGFPPGFEDIFAQFNINGSPFGFANSRRVMKNRDMSVEAKITLEEAYIGKKLMANIQLISGKEQVLEIGIPAGIQSGQRLRLSGMGDDSYPQMPRGDIYVNILVHPHPEFRREGDDLIKSINISVWDAILGTNIKVKTLDNKELNVTIPPGTQPSTVMRLAGYGMPNVNDSRFKGNILLDIKISIPALLTDEQKNLVIQLSK